MSIDNTSLQAELEAAKLRCMVLESALLRIARWHGEFPVTSDGKSYGYKYGANGERDYMRNLAAEALGLFK